MVVVVVVGYCGAVFVVVAVTHVIRLIESDSFIISLVYSWRVGGCGGGGCGFIWVVFVVMVVVVGYWWWCGGDVVVVVTAFVRVAVVIVAGLL